MINNQAFTTLKLPPVDIALFCFFSLFCITFNLVFHIVTGYSNTRVTYKGNIVEPKERVVDKTIEGNKSPRSDGSNQLSGNSFNKGNKKRIRVSHRIVATSCRSQKTRRCSRTHKPSQTPGSIRRRSDYRRTGRSRSTAVPS